MSIKNERLLSKAKKLLKKGQFNEARDIYLNILKSFPKNLEAKKALLIIDQMPQNKPSQNQLDEVMGFFSHSQFERAQISVQKLIEDFPNDPLLFNILGACCNEIGQTDLAINNFEKALTLKSDYIEVHYNLGVAFQKNFMPTGDLVSTVSGAGGEGFLFSSTPGCLLNLHVMFWFIRGLARYFSAGSSLLFFSMCDVMMTSRVDKCSMNCLSAVLGTSYTSFLKKFSFIQRSSSGRSTIYFYNEL